MPRLHALLLEDDSLDAELITRMLAKQMPDLSVAHVQSTKEYRARLADGGFDAVLSDGSVEGSEGTKAFHIARESDPAMPFIVISGADESARDLHGLRALGVSDFVPKSKLAQLAPALERALKTRQAPYVPDPRLAAGYERLVTVVKELSMARDLPGVMAVVRRAARELTGADGATFVLREGDLCHYADEDAIGPLWKGQKFPIHTCVSGWAMKHRQPAVVEDIFADPRVPVATYEPTFVRSVAMVPIRALDPIGAIGAYWATKRLPETHEVRLLQALADTTAVAMENVRVYAELDARVRERTSELEAFMFAVSHDLRAPLRHMQGFAWMLLEDHDDTINDEMRDGLTRITGAASRMSDMIDGLLTLSRTAQAVVARQPIDLVQVAEDSVDELRAAYEHRVEYVTPSTIPASGDLTLLRVVLQNLLGNAWKFSSKTASPRVELGVHEGPGERVYFVRDNGVGFEKTSHEKLFGVFQRLHRQDDFPGTGVGLATVQRVVRKHGGNVWASSTVGEGATFFFTLGDR